MLAFETLIPIETQDERASPFSTNPQFDKKWKNSTSLLLHNHL